MEHTDKELIENEQEHHEHHGEHHEHHEHHGEHHSHHKHSEHHSHHSSSEHKSGKKKRKKSRRAQKFLYYFKKNKKKIILNSTVIIGSVILLVGLLLLFADNDHRKPAQTEKPREDISVAVLNSAIRLEVPFYTVPQYIASEAVRAYMASDLQQDVSQVVEGFWSSKTKLDAGLPVLISYDMTGIPEGCKVEKAVIKVADNTDFKDAKVYELATGNQSVSVYHLKTGATYQYRVTLYISNGATVTTQSSFQTAQSPRMLSVDGLVNVRDIGGWETESGKTIRQGLLYRGSEMDGRVEQTYSITSSGLDTMLDVLKIRTEMDLRGIGYQGSLGNQVQYLNYGVVDYAKALKGNCDEDIRRIFADLADRNNYPVYMHCTYGMDRTGTVCFLLEALLGMSEEDLVREYELTAMHFGGVNDKEFDGLLVELKRQTGGSLTEKAENFLLSVGVTQEQINSIRSILLEA